MSVTSDAFDAHTRGMGYSVDELAALLHRLPSETRRLYFPEARRRLRVVG